MSKIKLGKITIEITKDKKKKVNKKSVLHEFRNTLVRFKIVESGKPCGRLYHGLRKYYGLTTEKDKRFERKYKQRSSRNKKVC